MDKAERGNKAVQYLRMSTEHQRYSMVNQAAAIGEFAAVNGLNVVRSYEDAGRSGLTLKGRDALQRLLVDALNPDRDFNSILVLDVSRWGRFQDPDQAAHYEFVCRQSGVAIIYCAEPFQDADPITGSIMKNLKRVMAAEYSRELSVKLSRAHLQAARLGRPQGGTLAYGYRRLLMDDRGNVRAILAAGEQKALKSDAISIIHGPPDELAVVRRVFFLYVKSTWTTGRIAKQLNTEGVQTNTPAPWNTASIRRLLRNELHIGLLTYNKISRKLHGRPKANQREDWVQVQILPPIVPKSLFKAAAARMALGQPRRWPDADLLADLRRLLQQNGYLSAALISHDPGWPACIPTGGHLVAWRAPIASLAIRNPYGAGGLTGVLHGSSSWARFEDCTASRAFSPTRR